MEMLSSAVCSSHPVLQRRCCLHSRLPRNRLTQLHCRAQAQSGSKERKYSIAEKVLIAGLGLSLTLGPLQVDQAQASIEDDNQQAQQALSFYQQRKAEAQRRKDLLAQRREKELEKGGTDTPSAPAAPAC